MKLIIISLLSLLVLSACSGNNSFNVNNNDDSNEKNNEPSIPVTTTSSTTTSTTTTTVSTTTTTLPPGACVPASEIIPGGTLVINDGASATTSLSVNLKLFRDGETGKMKISDNGNCECGTWERYNENKVWNLTKPNSVNTISVQFKDYEGAGSQCVRATIIHDTFGPMIQLALNPANTYWAGDATGLQLNVTDVGVGVQSVACKLNGNTTNCSAGLNDLLFQRQKAGVYIFEVAAADQLGNLAVGTIQWEMKERPTNAPKIDLSLDTNNTYLSDSDTKLHLAVTDMGDGVRNLVCSLNGIPTMCSIGTSVLVFPQQAVGLYNFEVSATNDAGKPTKASIAWVVTQKFLDIHQNIEIKSNNKVDILIVDDNSPSMEYEQQSMAKRMSTFLTQLSGLDWRIALTTTDPVHQTWGDGRLLSMKGLQDQFILTSTMPADQAQKVLGDTIQRSETGNPSEQGIYATYRAVERSLAAGTSPNKTFFRDDANFATIVISDEDESARNFKNIPENLVSFLKSTWSSKLFAFHSIITKPGDKKCLNTYGATYGTIYQRLSLLTGAGTVGGAIIGSVCETDYGTQLKGIGDSVQQMQRIMNLQCEPVGPTNSSVVVTWNGNNYTAPYEVQGLKLVFPSNLPKGQYELSYRCIQ